MSYPQQDRTKAEVYRKIGNMLLLNGEYDRAIENYTLAVKLSPAYALAYYARGEAHLVQEDYDRAIADFTRVTELEPLGPDAYIARGATYDIKGDHERAIGDYTRAIELNPGSASAYYNRGITYVSKGENNRAIEDFTRVIELGPKRAEAYYRRGMAYDAIGWSAIARGDLEIASELGNTDARAKPGKLRNNSGQIGGLLKRFLGRPHDLTPQVVPLTKGELLARAAEEFPRGTSPEQAKSSNGREIDPRIGALDPQIKIALAELRRIIENQIPSAATFQGVEMSFLNRDPTLYLGRVTLRLVPGTSPGLADDGGEYLSIILKITEPVDFDGDCQTGLWYDSSSGLMDALRSSEASRDVMDGIQRCIESFVRGSYG